MDLSDRAGRFRFLIRDRDSKFRAAFDDLLAGTGVRIIKTPARSPTENSVAERYAGTLRRECFDHLLIYGEQHLRRILAEYSRRYGITALRHYGITALRRTSAAPVARTTASAA